MQFLEPNFHGLTHNCPRGIECSEDSRKRQDISNTGPCEEKEPDKSD